MKDNVKQLLWYMAKGDADLFKIVLGVYEGLPKPKQLEFLGKARQLRASLENPNDPQHPLAKQIAEENELTEGQKRLGLTALAITKYHNDEEK